MNLFEQNLRSILTKEHFIFFNLCHLYDTIGEDFNDLVRSFSVWEFTQKDIWFTESDKQAFCYLKSGSELSKKITLFHDKFSSRLPLIHGTLILEILDYLMKMLSEEIHKYKKCKLVYADHSDSMVARDNRSKMVQSRECYTLNLDQFISLTNHQLMSMLVQYEFINDCQALNFEYVCEELEIYFEDLILKIKKAITTKKKLCFEINYRARNVCGGLGFSNWSFSVFLSHIVLETKIILHPNGFMMDLFD